MKRRKNESLIAKWKQALTSDETKTAAQVAVPKPESPSLALVKKVPVTFQLTRLEDPKDFELMSFVIKACNKTGERPFMKVLHVEPTRTGSRLVACDGRRLHFAEISKKIKSGDYKPMATKDSISLGEAEQDSLYPVWSRYVPENTEKKGVINLEKSSLKRDRTETDNLSLAFNTFVKHTGEPVNLRYLEDLTKREWEVYIQGKKQRVILLRQVAVDPKDVNKEGPYAVIMPLSEAA